MLPSLRILLNTSTLDSRSRKIAKDLGARSTLLRFALRMHRGRTDSKQQFRLATTDVFVEKAQHILTWRGRLFAIAGSVAGIFAVACFLYPAHLLFGLPLSTLLGDRKEIDGYILSVIVVKATSAGGLVVGAALFSMHICRAMLHEATIIFNRRHALRFGRLFLYLHDGPIKLDDLETAFKWTDEFSTAFRDIRPESIAPKSLTQAATEVAGKTIDGMAKVARPAARKKSPKPSSNAQV